MEDTRVKCNRMVIRKSIRQICNALVSDACMDKCCGFCCTNVECPKHHEKFKKIIVDDDCVSNNSTDEYAYNNWNDYKKDVRLIFDETTIIPHDLANIIIEYAQNEKLLMCQLCGYCEDDNDICYTCDGCKITYCDNCKPYHHNRIKCRKRRCHFCMHGTCFNNRNADGSYCAECFVEDVDSEKENIENIDDSMDSDFDVEEYEYELANGISEERKDDRKRELVDKLAEYKLVLREDSKLCEKYIDGCSDLDIDYVVERMCQMRYLYDHCNMNSAYEKARKSHADGIYAGHFPDCSIFDSAEMIALKKNNNKYPEEWPWMRKIKKIKNKVNIKSDINHIRSQYQKLREKKNDLMERQNKVNINYFKSQHKAIKEKVFNLMSRYNKVNLLNNSLYQLSTVIKLILPI